MTPGTREGKGERTRKRIIREALPLFSKQGFAGTAMSDVLAATGLRKGGVYGHFGGKEELALAVFDHALERASGHVAAALEGREGAEARLAAIAEAFAEMTRDPMFSGGCHVLNTVVDSDDTHPPLLERARGALERWRARIRAEAEAGVARGELRPDVDPDELATLFIAVLEGSVMLSKAYDDRLYIERAVRHLSGHVQGLGA